MEGLGAGELGRDLGELRGDELRRIDCNIVFAIVLNRGKTGEDKWMGRSRRRRRRRRREPKY